MIARKSIDIITVFCVSAALICSILLIGFSSTDISSAAASSSQPEYVNKLFGTDTITIDIQVDESSWQTMLDNAGNEEFIACNVVVNGKEFPSVGVRPKGNSSLSSVVSDPDSDRYSFKFSFDKYVKGQTCFGLDSFVVNNTISDATYMKEYLSYDIMRFIGVDTPMFGYASISVNGEYSGLYLAIECYNESFLSRTYGTAEGQLYNVKSMDMGGGRGMNAFRDMEEDSEQEEDPIRMPQGEKLDFSEMKRQFPGGGGGMPGGSGGGSMQYIDGSSDSYTAIFENAVFNNAGEEDYQKVITAIKALDSGENLEKYFNIDMLLRYWAAHTVVVNLDSYVSSMQQNYYIYENEGEISILPWDYNLAFGGFQSGNASSVVNFPIDTPVSGVELSKRPLIAKLFEKEEYLNKYHDYLNQIVTGYFDSGVFEDTVSNLDSAINAYVKTDPNAFYTYEEYQVSLPILTKLGQLRAESIKGQLAGTIPSTTEGQSSDSSMLIDASSIDLSVLGAQGGGGDIPKGTSFPEGEMPNFHGGMPDTSQNGSNMTSPPDSGFLGNWFEGGGNASGGQMNPFSQQGGTAGNASEAAAQINWYSFALTFGSVAVLILSTVAIALYRRKY